MIHDCNIVCIASNWHYDPTSKHHVMRELANRNHVVWVNYHGSRRPRVSAADAGAALVKLRQFIEGPRRVSDSMTVLTPIVAPWPGSRAVERLNRVLLTRQIRRVLAGLPSRPVQLWTFAPDVDYLVGRFDEECVIYYCVDAFAEFSGYDRRAIATRESRLIDAADLVITTSQALYEKKKPLTDRAVLVTHGVEWEHFACRAGRPPIPDDLKTIRRPILGFWGLIQDWVDLDLLAEIARARPDWSIVLIGEAICSTQAFQNLANIHLLGRRPYAELPAYGWSFDVGMIPFRRNALTEAVNPIKLREYLSCGLPVVSTDLPAARVLCDGVRRASGAGEWIAAIEAALSEPDRYRRERSEAMANQTWPAKVREIESHLERVRRRLPITGRASDI